VLDAFEEIVLCDFEFYGADGDRPNVVCLCARELRSGREFRLWRDQLGNEPPYRIDDKTLFVAYYASAELCCHLALKWKLPRNILDLFAEFRCLTNTSNEHQIDAGLLDAMVYFGLDCIDVRSKEHWRDVVLRGPPCAAAEVLLQLRHRLPGEIAKGIYASAVTFCTTARQLYASRRLDATSRHTY